MKKNNRKGFTTVELVIVIAVIAILAAVLIPTFTGLIEKANESAALQEANNVYKNYLIENAKTVTDDTVLYIQAGEFTFKVKDGKLGKEPITESEEEGITTAHIHIKNDTTVDAGYSCANSHDGLSGDAKCTCGASSTPATPDEEPG